MGRLPRMLDQSKTAPFTLTPTGPCRGAVLLLHGFTGSPWEVRPLGEALAARGFHVQAPRLPGHGTTPEALCYVTWHDWVAAAEQALAELSARFGPVGLGGLSMGALLGLVVASREPAQVAGLALLAPVVKLQRRGARLLHRVRHTSLPRLLDPWVRKETTDLELPDVRAEAPVLSRYPLARVLDLFELQALAQAAVPQVRCPSLVLAAEHDHVVDLGGVVALQARLPRSRLVLLRRGAHIIPRDADRAVALTETSVFFETCMGPTVQPATNAHLSVHT